MELGCRGFLFSLGALLAKAHERCWHVGLSYVLSCTKRWLTRMHRRMYAVGIVDADVAFANWWHGGGGGAGDAVRDESAYRARR